MHFATDEPDDRWLPIVGQWRWTVIGQDYSYHKNQAELAAIKQYGIGCFYLWGSEAPDWEILRCFARGYDRIVAADANTQPPYIYRVTRLGLLTRVPIP